ncbi:MAG: hypothetical protein ETSY1_30620 [Candidatus Entotheonella factor]|uniref:Uncharacterized protein n=1 Tax=Entotheonella factor TaxID=1429438 RepID=W4LBT1_ENTF1|nr:MAG: hypothetical protein ETSY1_30620 [Candidatus Entotheonella factor]
MGEKRETPRARRGAKNGRKEGDTKGAKGREGARRMGEKRETPRARRGVKGKREEGRQSSLDLAGEFP